MSTQRDLVDVDKLKVTDLKKELKARGLSTIGNKSELIERLQEVLVPASTDVNEEEINEDDVLGEDELLSENEKSAEMVMTGGVILASEELPLVKQQPPAVPQIAEKENKLVAGVVNKAVPMDLESSKEKADQKPPASVKALTNQERLELRAKRFSAQAKDVDRKMERARRFGVNVTGPANSASVLSGEYEKLKQRASRFGSNVSTTLKKVEDRERLKKRKERFGAIVVAGAVKNPEDLAIKKAKRAERFGIKYK